MDKTSFILTVTEWIAVGKNQAQYVIPAIVYLEREGYIEAPFNDEDFNIVRVHFNMLFPPKVKSDRRAYQKEYQREYRKTHPDKGEQWHRKHPEYAKEYHKSHLEEGAEYSRRYRLRQMYLEDIRLKQE